MWQAVTTFHSCEVLVWSGVKVPRIYRHIGASRSLEEIHWPNSEQSSPATGLCVSSWPLSDQWAAGRGHRLLSMEETLAFYQNKRSDGGCGYWPPSLFAFRCNVRKDGWTSCLPAHLETTRRGREIRETVRSSHFDGIGVAWINLNINFRSLVSHCVRRSMLACCSSLSQRHLNYYKVRTELRDSPRSQKGIVGFLTPTLLQKRLSVGWRVCH